MRARQQIGGFMLKPIATASACVSWCAIMGPAFGAGGAFFQVVQTLSFAVLAAWVWMIATGVILLRAAVRKPPMGEGV